MSTIRHPVQNHAWWYAAAVAVVFAGLLAVLMATVFSTAGSVVNPPTQTVDPPPIQGHHHVYSAPCFGHRPGSPIELSRFGC